MFTVITVALILCWRLAREEMKHLPEGRDPPQEKLNHLFSGSSKWRASLGPYRPWSLCEKAGGPEEFGSTSPDHGCRDSSGEPDTRANPRSQLLQGNPKQKQKQTQDQPWSALGLALAPKTDQVTAGA